MLSAVYQLEHRARSAANFDKDSGNRLYWRANRHRMTAEQVRDSVLFVSGALDTKMGGPSTPLTPLVDRRTVYGKVSRYKLDDYLQLFDFPSPNLSAEKRFTTNVPLQRLFFMNSDFMQQQGELLARPRRERAGQHRADPEGLSPDFRARADRRRRSRPASTFLTTEPMKAVRGAEGHEERKGRQGHEGHEEAKKEASRGDDDEKADDARQGGATA